MNDNENIKRMEALPDEALEKVAGGTKTVGFEDFAYEPYALAFKRRNNCQGCSNYCKENCPRQLDIGYKEFYNMFGGDPKAMCPNFKSM